MSSDAFPRFVDVRNARRRARSSTLALVAAAVLLAGCGTQRTPSNYGGSVKTHFVEACQGKNPDQQNKVSVSEATCTCAYDKISKKIPFKRFKQVNDQLSKKPAPLPKDFSTLVDECTRST